MTDAAAAPTAPAPEKASMIDDLIEIWTEPSKVFARRATSGFFLMMCLVTLLIGGLFLANRGAMQGIMDAEYSRQMAKVMEQNPGITQEQLAVGKKYADFFTSFGVFIGIPIGLFLIGFGTWVAGKVFGAELGYGAATMVASYAYLPKVLESLAITIQGLVLDTSVLTGRYQLTLGVGRFLDPTMSPGLLGLLGRLDIFTLWVSALLGIGVCVVGKLPRARIVPVAVALWALGAVPALWTLLMGVLKG